MRFPVDYIDVIGFFYDGNNIDFGYCPESPYVYSVDDGEVIYVQYQSKYNNVIFIKHNNGLVSMYKRLDSIYVKLGQKVANGEKIGIVGSTIGSSRKFLLFGLFSEGSDYLKGQSDLDSFDYLYLYQNQDVTLSTINRYGVKLKYHESYFANQNISYEEESLSQNTVLVEKSFYNDELPFLKFNLSYGIFFVSIFILVYLIVIDSKKKRSKRYI